MEKTSKWKADWCILEWYQTTSAACLWNMVTWSCKGASGNGSLVFMDHLSGKCQKQDKGNYSPCSTFYLPFMNIYHFTLCMLLFSHININFSLQITRCEEFLSVVMELTPNWVGWSSRMLVTALLNKEWTIKHFFHRTPRALRTKTIRFNCKKSIATIEEVSTKHAIYDNNLSH